MRRDGRRALLGQGRSNVSDTQVLAAAQGIRKIQVQA
jgi:hypothetical protein